MKVVYEPKGRAREYAPLAANLYNGCSHECRYCYVRNSIYRKYPIPEARKDILDSLRNDLKFGLPYPLFFSFMSDPYQPLDEKERLTREAIQICHDAGVAVQVLTKGGLRAVRDFDLLGADDYVAATLTFITEEKSREWEPAAAPPAERVQMLREAKKAGINTWVSMEPVIEPEETLKLIEATLDCVDLYRIGVLNHMKPPQPIDWREFGLKALDILQRNGARYYFKEDLKKAIPEYDDIAEDWEFPAIQNRKENIGQDHLTMFG